MALRRAGDMLASKYRIEALLGTGGMGDVYRATNVLVDREVAIKLLHVKHVGDPNLVERFLREARVANIVQHPNVVDILDIDKDEDGSPFIVQELLHGEDLSKFARARGRLDLDEIRTLVVPIIEAVAAAHAQGVIHRDIKPANVFLSSRAGEPPPSSGPRSGPVPRSGVRYVPKLLDFGISKLRAADIRATDVGVIMGTPAYMAPELIGRGVRDADARSDVWAIGVMLFELLAGRRPYVATGGAIYVAIATTDPPRLLDVAPDVDPDVASVVDRCLRRSVDERFASAGELAQALVTALDAALRRAPKKETVDLPAIGAAGPVVPDLDFLPTMARSDPTIADSTLHSPTPREGIPVDPATITEPMASAPALPTARVTEHTVRLAAPPPMPPRVPEVPPPVSGAIELQPRPNAPALGAPPMRPARHANDMASAVGPAHYRKQQDVEQLGKLTGVIALAGVTFVVAATLLGLVGRSAGWPVVRPFLDLSPQLASMAQVGASLVVAIVVVRSFRRAYARWNEAERGVAIAFASTSGLLLFVAIELLIAAW